MLCKSWPRQSSASLWKMQVLGINGFVLRFAGLAETEQKAFQFNILLHMYS